MRKIARRDDNHAEIVAAFRKLGCSVLDLAAVGSGCPDLLLGRGGKDRLVEVKDCDKPPSARKLTEDQARFHALWNGRPVAIVENLEDVERTVNNL